MRDLEQTMRDLEQTMRDLEQTMRDLEDFGVNMRDLEQNSIKGVLFSNLEIFYLDVNLIKISCN